MTPAIPPGRSFPRSSDDEPGGADGEHGAGTSGYENRFRRMFEAAPFALCYADRAGSLRICNQAFRDLFGLTEEACQGLSYRDVTHPDDLEESRQRLAELWSGRCSSVMLEKRYLHSSGRVFWADTSLYLLYDDHGKPTGSVAMLSDVTARKQAEEERAQQADELAHAKSLAEEQAARLAEAVEELESARSNAEKAADHKGEFLAVMSHEIRTPMNGVIGMTDLLLQTELKKDQRELVETIRTSGESLLAIINDILDFSKIEAGRIEFEHEPFEIRTCIEATMSLVIPRAATKRLNVAYLYAPDVPDIVSGDIMRLRQILVNLMSNAIKFTEEGEVVLSVDMHREGDREQIRFSVRDTGIGIAEDRMNKLFKSFSQIDASTARKYGGTGLGLAISKRLTGMFGGEMWAESTLGEGSTFHFTIDFDDPQHVEPVDHVRMTGRRVLIVERHEATREMLRQQLAPYRLDVTLTDSGADALRLIRDHDYDLAFIEADLPTLDGPTLARIITQVPRLKRLPVVFLHTLGQHVRVRGLEPAGTLAKPVKRKSLEETLVSTLEKKYDHPPSGALSPDAKPDMDKVPGLDVLLAEDNPVNQKVAVRMLRKLGYEADIANNGVEVLRRLEAKSYDVVLMDIMMPEMDGIEATRQILERYGEEERPRIIALTANAMRGDRERCLEAGMDDYLAKPLRVDLLKTALAGCIPSRKAASVEDAPNAEEAPAGGDGVGGDGADVALDATVPTIDLHILRELEEMMGGDDPNFLSNIIDEYLVDADGLMSSIRRAVKGDEGAALQHAAHTLKSSSSMFGASAMAATCKELEQIGAENRLKDARPHLKLLERQYQAVTRELKAQIRPA